MLWKVGASAEGIVCAAKGCGLKCPACLMPLLLIAQVSERLCGEGLHVREKLLMHLVKKTLESVKIR